MTLNGHKLALWQRARRRYAIENAYRYRRWHPQSLFSFVMRHAIFQLSNGGDLELISNSAVNQFLGAVKQPGLDVPQGTNTYTLAMDFASCIRTILEYLSRLTLLTLCERETISITDNLNWSMLAHEDESGVLHRWKFVDYISQDEIVRELHSWEVIGDIVVAKSPMMLHLVSIGRTHNSRRLTPWCRAYKSPAIVGMYRFQKKSGNPLEGDWKPVYFADNPKSKAPDWIDLMLEDNAAEPLVQHIQVKEPDQIHADNFYRDLDYEYNQLSSSGIDSTQPVFDPMSLPMCRTACDTPYICPHQLVCYSTKLTLANSGLYDRTPPIAVKEAGEALSAH